MPEDKKILSDAVFFGNEAREKTNPVHINLRKKPKLYIKKTIVDDFLSDKFIMMF